MKKILFFTSLGIQFLISQNQFLIRSSVRIEGLPEEYAGFGESEKTVYIKGEKVKSETTNMMSSTTEVFDGKKVTVLVESMGQKMAWSDTPENIESANPKEKEPVKPKVEKTSETKMIAGYECTKYIITIPAEAQKTDAKKKQSNAEPKKDLVIVSWVTDKISRPKSYADGGRRGRNMNIDESEIKGYPFQTEMDFDSQGMKMKYIETVTEVSTDPIPDNVFQVNTDGYTVKTYKEFVESMKKQEGAN